MTPAAMGSPGLLHLHADVDRLAWHRKGCGPPILTITSVGIAAWLIGKERQPPGASWKSNLVVVGRRENYYQFGRQ